MRPKEVQCLVTFNTTTDAMAFEDAAKEAGLEGRLIPIPTLIKAGCGLAWRENPQKRSQVERILKDHKIAYDKIYEIEI